MNSVGVESNLDIRPFDLQPGLSGATTFPLLANLD
jgi:hypothetical protein